MAVEHAKKVRVDDTLEMGYYIDDCTDPWKTPETIVLLPGCFKPRQVFYAWIPTLARHFRVIRPHLRGHWDSTPAPESYKWTVDGLVSDLKNFLDRLGLDKVHLVGESLGGFLGFHLAYHYPEHFKTLTLVTAPGPNFKHHPLGRLRSFEAYHPVWGVDEEWTARNAQEFGPENQALCEWSNNERWKSPQAATNGYFEAAANCEVNEEEFLPRIGVKTLYLIGAENTRIITVEDARRLCDLMPRAQLVTFPGVNARCQFVIPEKCAEEVVRFISEQK